MFRESILFIESARLVDWVVVFAYFDETGTSGGAEKVTAVAGYLFDRAGRERFLDAYRTLVEPRLPLDKRGRRIFHAAKLAGGYDQFFQLNGREEIARAMARALSESVTVGVVVGVEPETYRHGARGPFIQMRSSHPGDSLAKRAGSKYSQCLFGCIEQLTLWMAEQGMDGSLEYVFEAGCNHEVEAFEMLSRANSVPRLQERWRLGKFYFANKGPEMPWLFAADFLVWEWQRRFLDARRPEVDREHRDVIDQLVEAKPHFYSMLTAGAVNIWALFNSFYGLRRHDDR